MNKEIKEAFDRVTADNELKEKAEDYVLHYMSNHDEKQSPKRKPRKKLIGLVFSLALVFIVIGSFVYQQPVSAISINSTSSIEIYFNRFNRLIDVVKYDENGEPSSEKIIIDNKKFADVMDEVLSDVESEEIYITVASNDEKTSEQMMTDLSHHQEMMGNMHLYQSTKEVMQEAQAYGTSMGRMHAMHQLQEYDSNNTQSDIENESTQNLMEAVEKHHQEMMEGNGTHHHHGGYMKYRR